MAFLEGKTLKGTAARDSVTGIMKRSFQSSRRVSVVLLGGIEFQMLRVFPARKFRVRFSGAQESEGWRDAGP